MTKHEIQTLTQEQAHKLLEAAHGHRLEALLTVAVTTGMRRGELLGYSNISMTMDTYSHVLPLMQQEVMDRLNDLFQ
jgi:site-specific recombinase XerD